MTDAAEGRQKKGGKWRPEPPNTRAGRVQRAQIATVAPLLLMGATTEQIATKTGISPRHVKSLRESDECRAAVDELAAEAVERKHRIFEALEQKALVKIDEVLNDASRPDLVLEASKTLLDRSDRYARRTKQVGASVHMHAMPDEFKGRTPAELEYYAENGGRWPTEDDGP